MNPNRGVIRDWQPARRERMTAERRWFLEILTLSSVIVAQPVLDVFGRSPETFVFNDAGRLEIVLFALLVTLVPSVGLWAISAAIGTVGSRARRITQTAVICLLLSFLGVQVIKRLSALTGPGLALVGVLSGVLFTWGIVGLASGRRWLRLAWPVSIVFALIFLLLSPVSNLVLPKRERALAAPQDAEPISVVLVVFDQMPLLTLLDTEGGIDASRFPNFARLAEDATWFRNYTVNESLTRYSMPTILSGTFVTDRSKHPTSEDHPNNLFALLQNTHELNVYELVTKLCPVDPCHRALTSSDSDPSSGSSLDLFEEAAGVWLELSWIEKVTRDVGAQFEEELAGDPAAPETGGQERDLTRDEQSRHIRQHRRPYQLSQLLTSMTAGARPTLHFIHVLVPHYPWRFFSSGIEYLRPEPDSFGRAGGRPARWSNERWPAELYRLRHVLQTQFADRLLGDVVARLQESGEYERTLLIVTSDHGHSFHPGRPGAAARDENMHEILWVPLLIKAPHQQDELFDDRNVMSTDLLPTIADYLGVSIPWSVDGKSLLRADSDRGPVKNHRDLSIAVSEAWRRLVTEAFTVPRSSPEPKDHPYPIGPRADLLGRPVSELQVGPPAESTVSLDLPDVFRDPVDAANGVLPALVSGVMRGPTAADSQVVVAVNDRVAGVSPIFGRGDGTEGFMVLAPESFFKTGKNSLRLFLVDDDFFRPLRY